MIGTLERRSFGDGVCVSVLGVGCSLVGSISNPVPMREIDATLEAAVEAGVNLFDTADIYGQGDSERTLRGHRECVPIDPFPTRCLDRRTRPTSISYVPR